MNGNPGGGNAAQPYLQKRNLIQSIGQATGGTQTQPVVTPKSIVSPGEVANKAAPPAGQGQMQPGQSTSPPQLGGSDLAGVYNFLKSDLENQRKQAIAGSIADASARGVYYGTPLTGSEADIQTQYLRGLGQLGAGMYGNLQQDRLARLALATQMVGPMANAPSPGGLDPSIFQTLGQLYGGSPVASGARTGPTGPMQRTGKTFSYPGETV